jgi:hypothetical protein
MAKDPLRLSRSRWDSFIKCPKCFYLKEKHNIGPPSQPGHPINSRVDALLKEEFDLLRKDEKPHKIFKEYNLNFIPYNKLDPEVLAKYRNNFKGVEAKSKKTKYTLFGSLDDLWFNLDTKEIVVLDYKATSNKNLEDYKTSTKHYHKAYLRQLDFYAYLLKLNNFTVHKIGYWLISNAADENQKVFNNNVSFKTTLLPYELKTDYIEDTLVELEKCLNNKEIPISGDDCDNCRWFKEVKKTEELISIDKDKNKEDFRNSNFSEISKGNYEFILHCGDLYTRENVSWDEDLEYCRLKIVSAELKDVQSLKVKITYTIPDNDDIDEMKKKSINQYQIDSKKHLYTVELLNFNQDEGKFRICEEIWIGYENTIKELIKQLKNLKQIYFFGRYFRESENGFSFDLIDDDDYIRQNCNNPKWEDSMFIEPVEDKDYLEQLILLKKQVGTNVKINFESLSEDSEKLVKKFKIRD